MISAYLFGALFIRHIHPHKTTSELLNLVKMIRKDIFPGAPSLNSGHGIPIEFHTAYIGSFVRLFTHDAVYVSNAMDWKMDHRLGSF